MTRAPTLKACRLWAKTSAAGNTYFVGRWGGVKVLVRLEPSHNLFVCEAVEKLGQGAQDARSAADLWPPS